MRQLKSRDRGYGRENPGQLGDLWHIALPEEGGFVWIQSASEEIEGHTPAILAQNGGFADAGERVIVCDEVKGFAFILERDRRSHHAEVVADVQNAGRLNAGKNAHGCFHPPNTLRDAKTDSATREIH